MPSPREPSEEPADAALVEDENRERAELGLEPTRDHMSNADLLADAGFMAKLQGLVERNNARVTPEEHAAFSQMVVDGLNKGAREDL